MQKLKNEVDTIADYFLILEKYMFNISDVTYDGFWTLKGDIIIYTLYLAKIIEPSVKSYL